MPFLEPERYFARVTRICPQADLLDCGYVHMLLDMDNTILSRSTHDVPLDVRAWLGKVRAADVKVCLLSNNWHSSPYETARMLDLPVVAKACKPLPHGYLAARQVLGARSADTVVVGDQLSTDVVGAHMLGMAAYLVCPLVEKDLLHTRAIRNLERALLGQRVPEGASACAQAGNAQAGNPQFVRAPSACAQGEGATSGEPCAASHRPVRFLAPLARKGQR